MTKKSNDSKLNIYGLLVGLFLVVGLGLSILTTSIAYPTTGHRQVAAEFTDLNNTAFTAGNLEVVNTAEYKRLSEDPHTVYSDRVNNIGLAIQLSAWVAAVVIAYRYIRKYRLVKKPVRMVALAEATAAVLTIIPADLFLRQYAGVTPTFGIEFPLGIFMLVFTFIYSLLLTLLIAKIAEWHYNRTHGFVEE